MFTCKGLEFRLLQSLGILRTHGGEKVLLAYLGKPTITIRPPLKLRQIRKRYLSLSRTNACLSSNFCVLWCFEVRKPILGKDPSTKGKEMQGKGCRKMHGMDSLVQKD